MSCFCITFSQTRTVPVTGGECFLNVLLKESRKKTKRGCKELENKSKKQKFPTKFGVLQQNNYKRFHGKKNKMKSLRYNSLKDLCQREENKTCLCTLESQKKLRSTQKKKLQDRKLHKMQDVKFIVVKLMKVENK